MTLFTVLLFLVWFVSSQKAPHLLKRSCGVGFEPTQRSAVEDLPGWGCPARNHGLSIGMLKLASPHFFTPCLKI